MNENDSNVMCNQYFFKAQFW